MKLANRRVLHAAVGSAAALVAVIAACLIVAGNDAPTPQSATLSGAPRSPGRAAREVPAPSAKTTNAGAAAANDPELLKRIEHLEKLLADAARSEAPPELHEPVDGGDRDEPFSPEAEEEKALAQFRAQVETLETVLHAEFVDEDWAKPAVIALREAFGSETAEGIEMVEVDCRGTMCRLSLAFDPARAEESFRSLPGIIPWEGETFFQVDDIESGRAVVYVAREEQRLPRAE